MKIVAIVLGIVLLIGTVAFVVLSWGGDKEVGTEPNSQEQNLNGDSSENNNVKYEYSFEASPIDVNGNSVLSWNAPEGSVCKLRLGKLYMASSEGTIDVSISGTYTVSPSVSQAYSMSCHLRGGDLSQGYGQEVTVNVD